MHDVSVSRGKGSLPYEPVQRPTAFARLMTGLQMLGTVLAIPLGLVSGYSIYHANFSPDATCGNLRASIISMLDKSADASTLRMLVRRDVTSFERSCGAVDPDAVAAFKTLLAKPEAVAASPRKVTPMPPERVPAEHLEAKKRVAEHLAPAHVNDKTAGQDADAAWLDAVRHALVAHDPIVPAKAAEALVPPATPPGSPMGKSADEGHVAPALPPVKAVAEAPPPHSESDHPVPPGLIPNVGPAATAAR